MTLWNHVRFISSTFLWSKLWLTSDVPLSDVPQVSEALQEHKQILSTGFKTIFVIMFKLDYFTFF